MLGWGKRRTKPARERREPGFDESRADALRVEPDDRVGGGKKRRKSTGADRREPRFDDRDDLRAEPRENNVARRTTGGGDGG